MQHPDLEAKDFRELSYLGWNDSGTNRKYLLRKIDGRFVGAYGAFSTDVQKAIVPSVIKSAPSLSFGNHQIRRRRNLHQKRQLHLYG